MPKPVIGVTTFHSPSPWEFNYLSVTEKYVTALLQAGALPVLIPVGLGKADLQQLEGLVDGVLFSGGGDIDPECYDAPSHPTVHKVDPQRDQLEIDLAREISGMQKPFLGICRGLQLINVALGGTLYTDVLDQLPGAMKHDFYPDPPRDLLSHSVQIEANSCLAGILKAPTVKVNSLHHQAVKKLAPGLQAVAFAEDGVIEALELPGHPFGLAVQWHPEWLTEYPEMRALFRSFVVTAANGNA